MITDFDIFQPWSTFVLGTTLPSEVLERMIKLTDEIIEDRAGTSDDTGAAQIEDEFLIDLEKFAQEEVQSFEFLMEACGTYVIQAYCQSKPFNKEQYVKKEWELEFAGPVWINSQKDNEYFSIHTHVNCAISASIYLKIPEYLPSRKSYEGVGEQDGAITFTNNVSLNRIWGFPIMQVSPQVGDFFIFPSAQLHQVYPFRTPDGKGERRSVSFNAEFTSKSEQDFIKKQQERR